MKQVLCVWFPNWAVQRVLVRRPELRGRMVVLHTPSESRHPSVTACSTRANRRGVKAGMPLAEARTLVASGWFGLDDPEGDREGLRHLAWTLERFTPVAGLEESERPESLFLDVTGCVQHFGSLPQLCKEVREHFRRMSFWTRIGAAPTFGAAWGVSHAVTGERVVILEGQSLTESLSPLPVWSLRLSGELRSLLSECGLRSLGQLLKLPRASLPSRFGPELLLRLDQALGLADELLKPERQPSPVRAVAQFEFPLDDLHQVEAALQPLLVAVLSELDQSRRETQHLRVTWKTECGEAHCFDIRSMRPTTNVKRFRELLALHLERGRIGGGVTALSLEAAPCRCGSVRRLTLFDEDDGREGAFLHLVERLSSRLGPESVVRLRLLPEAQPELAVVTSPWLSAGAEVKEDEPGEYGGYSTYRPLRLLSVPVSVQAVTDHATGLLLRFRWQYRDHVVFRCEGPERIETGWWRSAMIRRDYFRVETTAGARFWLFRELSRAGWFLQGVFE